MCQCNQNVHLVVCPFFAFHMKETIFEAYSCSRYHISKWYGRALVPASTNKPKARLFENNQKSTSVLSGTRTRKGRAIRNPDGNLHYKSDSVFHCRRCNQLVTAFLNLQLIFLNESALHTQHIILFCAAEYANPCKYYCTQWFLLYVCCTVRFLNIKNVHSQAVAFLHRNWI
jgi:hypothetical protein